MTFSMFKGIKNVNGLWQIVLGPTESLHLDDCLVTVETVRERPLVVVIADLRSGIERRSPPLTIRQRIVIKTNTTMQMRHP